MPADFFSVDTPSPDEGHEAIRLAVVAAIQDLAYTTDDAALGLDLADTLFALLDSAMVANDALAERLGVLEQWHTDTSAASGDTLSIAGNDTDGWTWARTASNGTVIAVSDSTYSRGADAWRGARRANPDL